MLHSIEQTNSMMDAEIIVSICACLVAVFAMIATLWQAKLMKKHNKISVRPHLDWDHNGLFGEPLTLGIYNHGLGPAIVDSIEFQFKNITCKSESSKLPSALADYVSQMGLPCKWSMISPGTPISPNQHIEFFRIEPVDNKISDHEHGKKFIESIGFKIKYRSMYDEFFVLSKNPI